MEKLGVIEDVNQDKLEKAAEEGCPKCASAVRREGDLIICPKCGTEPFEDKNSGS